VVEAREVAERVARERGASIQTAGEPFAGRLLARGAFQRRNFALAQTAAEVYASSSRLTRSAGLEPAARPAAGAAAESAAESTAVRGRLQVAGDDPLTVLDGAHNPHAVAALLESLGELVEGRPLALVLGVLEDKDAASMLAGLLSVSDRAWFTSPPSSRALSPAALQSLARQLGFDAAVTEPRPARALQEARRWARSEGGAVLVTGSVYLVGELMEAVDGCGSVSDPAGGRRGEKR
jgi:dihydrofolate synthase/folylpolyglutamate synthase